MDALLRMRLGHCSGSKWRWASGIGSAVGISGNLGVTDRARHEQGPDGSFKSHTKTLHGFAGGVDVAGRRVALQDIILGWFVFRDVAISCMFSCL